MNKILQVSVACLISSQAQAGEPDWKLVQAIGGIAIGTPTRMGAGWLLPVNADVSGSKQITTKPMAMNSALVCEKSRVVVERNNIYISLVTSLARKPYKSACPAATLEHLPPGKYRVCYRGPSERPEYLSEVRLEP